jgi:proton-translocating NADH-quinone oxidoreductase chain M
MNNLLDNFILEITFFNYIIKTQIINLLVIILLITILFLMFTNAYAVNRLKIIAFNGSVIVFFLSVFLAVGLDVFYNGYQYTITFPFFKALNIQYILGIDGISVLFIILTTFLIPFCILISCNSINYNLKYYLILFLVCEIFLINVFSSLDVIVFYIFFESVLIPMFFIVGVWGSRTRRIHAAYQFFLYTLLGSLIMLVSLLFIHSYVNTTDLQILSNTNFSYMRQLLIWIAFFLSFAVKIPMLPFHIWLPEAHVEAPTAGSVLLAGVLLKLGSYGFLRFSIPLFAYATQYFIPFMYTLAIIGIIYGSLTTIRQIDCKKIIAYSSVVHMNFAIIGLFSLNMQGLGGSYS